MITASTPSWDGSGPVPISASQLSTFESCKRLWGYEKVEGRRKPDTDATADGTAIHSEVEAYFRHGTHPVRPESQILLTHLPKPAPELLPEAEFTLAWPGVDALLRGKIDLVDPRNHTIYDHKTTSSIDRYAKSSDELRLDAQTVMYGLAYRAMFSKVEEINLRWNYVKREQPKTRPPQTRPVDLVQDLTLLEEGLQKWHPVVVELVQITKSRVRALDIPANPGDACFKFGGCPFRDECPDYAGKRKIVEPPVSDPAVLALLAKLGAATPAPLPDPEYVAAAVPAKPPLVLVAPSMPLLDSVRIAFDVQSAVVPPDAQPNVSKVDPPPPPVVEVKRGRGRPKKTPVESGLTAGPPPPTEPVGLTAAETEQPWIDVKDVKMTSWSPDDLPVPAPIQVKGLALPKSAQNQESPTDAELIAFVELAIRSVGDKELLQTRLDAARLAMDLLSYRRGG